VTSNPTEPEQQGTEQQRVADGLRSLGTELASVADRGFEPPVAADLARQAASAAHGLAEWLDQQDPSTLNDELSAFARRHPETLLAIALGAGLAHGPRTAEWTGLGHQEAAPSFAQPLPVDTAETVDNSPYAGDTAYVDDPGALESPLPAPTLLPPVVPSTLPAHELPVPESQELPAASPVPGLPLPETGPR